MTIRLAQPQDSPALFLLACPFATSFAVEQAAFERSFDALLTQPDACVIVAEADQGEIVGYLLGFNHLTFFANGCVAWVEEVMVSETHRRQGVGQQLVEAFEAWATERGAKQIALATRRAAEFYEALGYQESAVYFRKQLEKKAQKETRT